MQLNDIKPLGAFIENTIRPIIAEFGDLLFEFQRQGIQVTEHNITNLCKSVAYIHLKTVVIQAIRDVIIAVIVGAILWKMYQ